MRHPVVIATLCLTICCAMASSCRATKKRLPHANNVISLLWAADTCGVSGNRKIIGDFIFTESERKPYFKNLPDVEFLLGSPDTIFQYPDTYVYFYVTWGTPLCMKFYPDGVYRSLQVFIDKKSSKVISVTGGFH